VAVGTVVDAKGGIWTRKGRPFAGSKSFLTTATPETTDIARPLIKEREAKLRTLGAGLY